MKNCWQVGKWTNDANEKWLDIARWIRATFTFLLSLWILFYLHWFYGQEEKGRKKIKFRKVWVTRCYFHSSYHNFSQHRATNQRRGEVFCWSHAKMHWFNVTCSLSLKITSSSKSAPKNSPAFCFWSINPMKNCRDRKLKAYGRKFDVFCLRAYCCRWCWCYWWCWWRY